MARAFEFLGIIPVPYFKASMAKEEDIGRSSIFFPLVGFIYGLILVISSLIIAPFVSKEVCGILLCLILLILSRGLHIDGLSDTFDALGCSKSIERKLEIMKDSTVGPFGVTSINFILLLKIFLVSSLVGQGGLFYISILLFPVLGRWAIVIALYFGNPARDEGLGKLFFTYTKKIEIKNVNFLNNRVIQLSKVKVITHIHKHQESASEASVIYKNSPLLFNRIIAIASSTGGPLALSAIVKHLPPDFTTPIVIAQHITNGYIDPLIKYLHDYTKMKIKEGTDGDSISPNTIYISPSNKHMEITSFGKIKLIEIIESDIYHPSCDKLLTSTARAFGKIVIGVILTGMGQDGVQGMKDIKEAGGITIAQSLQSTLKEYTPQYLADHSLR
ncbi:MAG: adenosylcobinamide-GDP ribazoletransferase [Nitrospirae bacterium]|nr:adenosylcobinamide-GDP ribazoletransferase [Nitrospirota bacterium]